MGQALVKRRQLLEKHILPKLEEPIRYSPILQGSLHNLYAADENPTSDALT